MYITIVQQQRQQLPREDVLCVNQATTSATGGFFMTMAHEIQPTLLPLENVASGTFTYGRAEASIVHIGEANRNARVIARKLEEIAAGLHLQIDHPQERRVISHDNGNAFAEAHLGGKTHFLMVRSPLDGRSFEQSLHGEIPEITIVSGPCLFSAEGVQAVAHSGQQYALTRRGEHISEPIQHIAVDEKLSLYEIEAITRLGNFIHDLATNNSHIRRVALNIPEAEYYLYALNAYQQGYIDQQQMLRWFDAVDQRHQRQVRLLSKMIGRRNNVRIEEASPLRGIKEYIRKQVREGNTPRFEDAMTQLAAQDGLWADMLAVSEIGSWQDIIDLSYIHAELSAAEQVSDRPTFALAIESPTESKIFASAKKVATALQAIRPRQFNATALFPHELMLPVGANATKTMYHIAEDNGGRLGLMRAIVGQYRRRHI